MNNANIEWAIANAIKEDIGDGDHSTRSCIPSDATGKAQLLVKQKGIIAGIEIAKLVFNTFDSQIRFESFMKDGDSVQFGDIAFTVEGKVQSILTAERLVLNILQRMSGIATTTHTYVKKISNTTAKVLDTRKTTPNFRYFEKLAVQIGGGENHRMGLYDMIMLKDNHIDFAGGIEKAIQRTTEYLESHKKSLKVEIEVRNLKDIEEVLRVGKVDRIMFDNFSVDLTAKAVKLVDHAMETESSGGITLNNIEEYARTGVDYISVGALTHQIRSLDMSLKAMNF